MNNVIEITNFKLRELDEVIESGLKHSDPEVLLLWKQMARSFIKKYAEPVKFEKSHIAISVGSGLSDLEEQNIRKELLESLESIKSAYNKRILDMTLDVMLLQKSLAECQVKTS